MNEAEVSGRGVLTVLYDADCGVCTHTARALVWLDTRRRLRLVALQSAAITAAPPMDRLLAALHATDGDGRWYVGGAALVAIAQRIPLLRPLALVARLPLATRLIDGLYRVIADNRSMISRVLRLEACRVEPYRR